MSVFAEDASAQYAFPGVEVTLPDKAAIREFLSLFVGPENWLAHNMMMPYIVVDGNTASGAFYLWNLGTPSATCPDDDGDGEVGWIQGWYNNEYKKIKGEWNDFLKEAVEYTRSE